MGSLMDVFNDDEVDTVVVDSSKKNTNEKVKRETQGVIVEEGNDRDTDNAREGKRHTNKEKRRGEDDLGKERARGEGGKKKREGESIRYSTQRGPGTQERRREGGSVERQREDERIKKERERESKRGGKTQEKGDALDSLSHFQHTYQRLKISPASKTAASAAEGSSKRRSTSSSPISPSASPSLSPATHHHRIPHSSSPKKKGRKSRGKTNDLGSINEGQLGSIVVEAVKQALSLPQREGRGGERGHRGGGDGDGHGEDRRDREIRRLREENERLKAMIDEKLSKIHSFLLDSSLSSQHGERGGGGVDNDNSNSALDRKEMEAEIQRTRREEKAVFDQILRDLKRRHRDEIESLRKEHQSVISDLRDHSNMVSSLGAISERVEVALKEVREVAR